MSKSIKIAQELTSAIIARKLSDNAGYTITQMSDEIIIELDIIDELIEALQALKKVQE